MFHQTCDEKVVFIITYHILQPFQYSHQIKHYWTCFSIFILLMMCPSIGVGIIGLWLSLSSEVLLLYFGQWVTVWALSPVARHLE